MSVAAASRGVPAGRGITPLADVPDGERRYGGPELVIRCEYSVIPMPVLPWRRHDTCEPVQLTFGRQGHPWPLQAYGVSSTTPTAPGRVDFRPRPLPT